jgi:hypothetical protein
LSVVTSLFGWIGRHLLLFLLIVAALVLHAQLSSGTGSVADLQASADRLAAAEAALKAQVAGLENRAVTALDYGQRNSLQAIDARIASLRLQQATLAGRTDTPGDLLSAPQDVIVDGVRRQIDVELIDQELAFLGALRANVESRGRALTLDGQIAQEEARITALDAAIRADAENIRTLPSDWSPDRYVREGLTVRDLQDVYAERQAENRAKRAAAAARLKALIDARNKLGDIRALATPAVAIDALERHIAPVSQAAQAQNDKLAATLEGQARKWYQRLGIADLLWPALGVLALIILTPLAIRTLFYWVLAPLAALQRPITLLEPGAPIPVPADRSAVSKGVRLAAGEELLVKQGYLQSPSDSGSKATQIFLDARFALTSLATGLFFLTRIRNQAPPGSADTHSHTVSATRDPFAEVALLALPAGAACVLQPRAIAGVVQPTAAPMRITSHWRLGTLNAWLTWQLRFLVFHGPATLVLKGGRGIRMEPVEAGRSLAQDQLVGFSAGLSYSTRRTETFLPYLFGQEPLLKDRVATGTGLLIAEEAPMAGSRRGFARGLEGVTDAVLKAFGV